MKCEKCGHVNRTRSLPQNSYYWGVVIDILSNEWGEHPKKLHRDLMTYHLGVPNEKTGMLSTPSSTELTPKAFEDYVERVRVWAMTDHNIFIPLPNENI